MNLLVSGRTALLAIQRNKLRSALAMVGIVIAVAAVVATVALGAGARAKVARQMATLGSNLLIISPGAVSTKGASTGDGAAQTLTLDDGRAIERELSALVAAVAPLNRVGAQVVNGDANWFTQVIGSTPAYLEVRDWALTEGEPFGKEDEAGAKVCVLGATVKKRLFGETSPVGAQIRVGKLPCRVVGALAAKGQSNTGHDQDDMVLMPWHTLARRVQGQPGDVVGQLLVEARSPALVAEAQAAVTLLLRQRHHLAEGAENDFRVRNLADIQNAANQQTATISLLLGAIALISLIVGAIGIANVMLVSVTERTREIGIRIAIGARSRDVLVQFLLEALALAAVGGIFGLIVGAAASAIMAAEAGWPTQLSPLVMAGAVALAGLAGIAAGFYPALRASRLDPIDALRFE